MLLNKHVNETILHSTKKDKEVESNDTICFPKRVFVYVYATSLISV